MKNFVFLLSVFGISLFADVQESYKVRAEKVSLFEEREEIVGDVRKETEFLLKMSSEIKSLLEETTKTLDKYQSIYEFLSEDSQRNFFKVGNPFERRLLPVINRLEVTTSKLSNPNVKNWYYWAVKFTGNYYISEADRMKKVMERWNTQLSSINSNYEASLVFEANEAEKKKAEEAAAKKRAEEAAAKKKAEEAAAKKRAEEAAAKKKVEEAAAKKRAEEAAAKKKAEEAAAKKKVEEAAAKKRAEEAAAKKRAEEAAAKKKAEEAAAKKRAEAETETLPVEETPTTLNEEALAEKCRKDAIGSLDFTLAKDFKGKKVSVSKNLSKRDAFRKRLKEFSVSNLIFNWHSFFTHYVLRETLRTKSKTFENYVNKKINSRGEYNYFNKEKRIYFEEVLDLYQGGDLFQDFHPSFEMYLEVMVKLYSENPSMKNEYKTLINPSSITYLWIDNSVNKDIPNAKISKESVDRIETVFLKSKKGLDNYLKKVKAVEQLKGDCLGVVLDLSNGYWRNNSLVDYVAELPVSAPRVLNPTKDNLAKKVLVLGNSSAKAYFFLSFLWTLPKIYIENGDYSSEKAHYNNAFEKLKTKGKHLRKMKGETELREYRSYLKAKATGSHQKRCYSVHVFNTDDKEKIPWAITRVKKLGIGAVDWINKNPWSKVYVGPFYSKESRDKYMNYLKKKVKNNGWSDFTVHSAQNIKCGMSIVRRNQLMRHHKFQDIISK